MLPYMPSNNPSNIHLNFQSNLPYPRFPKTLDERAKPILSDLEQKLGMLEVVGFEKDKMYVFGRGRNWRGRQSRYKYCEVEVDLESREYRERYFSSPERLRTKVARKLTFGLWNLNPYVRRRKRMLNEYRERAVMFMERNKRSYYG